MENGRRCEMCYVDVQRASMQKHLRRKKHLQNEKQPWYNHGNTRMFV